MLRRGMALASQDAATIIEVLTPKQTPINVPMAFAESPRFSVDLRRIVATAHAGDSMPIGVGDGLDAEDIERLESMHKTLTDVCREEGNSVWAWYLTNYISPYMLARRGVDRIVANPPWVRMSDIQVRERKRALESRIAELGVGAGGKNATGFDIGGLFVDQCREHYLKGDSPAAGWVLNWASMKAGNWAKVREKHEDLTTTYLDLSKVRQPPFTGAKACVWLQRGKLKSAPSTRVYSNRRGKERIVLTDGQREFEAKTNWVLHEKHFGDAPSDYSDSDGPSFAQGAIITPAVLVKLSEFTTDRVTTTKSRHQPWKQLSTQRGKVPTHYVKETLFSSDLLVFGCDQISRSIIPLTERGTPDFYLNDDGSFNFSKGNSDFWNQLNELYETHRGQGSATPKTLWAQLNFQNKLMKQLESPSYESHKVAYNTSGQILRAARILNDKIIDSSCYYLSVPESEAAYMTSILNAPCLQMAFQESRESDRHFHLHPTNKVPIPKFDRDDPAHLELIELCELAEMVAKEVIDGLADNTGQIKASNTIRQQLMIEGLADAIDDVVRRVLPSHSVHEYTEDIPHPWR